tara:strand:- start:1541 stop:2572 length:1032 start_codon:yes stop_codon:yes gene_type:complete
LGKRAIVALLIFCMITISSCGTLETLYGAEGDDISNDEIDIDEFLFAPDITTTTETEEGVEVIDTSEEGNVDFNEGSENAVVIFVEETELVQLKPQAEDPDDDELVFTYTSPVDEYGEWQTEFGDIGEYTITVTVSDGKETDSQDVLIIVNKKEEPPIIIGSDPEESTVSIPENEVVSFSVSASDPNDDIISYVWKLDGNEVSGESEFEYEAGFDDGGSHTIKVDVSDGINVVNKIWSLTISDVNRIPIFEVVEDVNVKETEIATILLFANDEDGDNLEFSVDDSRFIEVADNEFEWETDYDSEGEYLVGVSVTDGIDTVDQEMNVIVENLNRAPKIVGFEQK